MNEQLKRQYEKRINELLLENEGLKRNYINVINKMKRMRKRGEQYQNHKKGTSAS